MRVRLCLEAFQFSSQFSLAFLACPLSVASVCYDSPMGFARVVGLCRLVGCG